MNKKLSRDKEVYPKKIRKIDLFKVFLRSFFVQSVWNYRNMISVGFEFCLFPVVKRLYPNLNERKDFLKRHLKFFNGHPYMISYALGASIRLEEENSKGETCACDQLDRLKELLIGPLGAVGDQLFWFTLKPVSLIIGVLGIAIFNDLSMKIAAIGFAFLIYNIPHLYLRYLGIVEGYQYGIRICECIRRERFDRLRAGYLYAGFAAILVLSVYLFRHFWLQDWQMVLFFVGSGVYAYFARNYIKNFYQTCTVTILFFIFLAFIIL